MDAKESDDPLDPLGQLHRELHERGWITKRTGDRLTVTNPNAPTLNDTVTVTETKFCYSWGPIIGPLTEVSAAADRIARTLRTVGQGS